MSDRIKLDDAKKAKQLELWLSLVHSWARDVRVGILIVPQEKAANRFPRPD